MLRILFLILSLLSIQSCGPKKSSEAQFVINLGAMTGSGNYPGGVIIYGQNLSGTQRFSRAITTASYNIELENGEWSFYSLTWSGPSVFDGVLKCAHTVARLNGDPLTISLTPQIATCDSEKFSPPVFRKNGLIQPLKFITCSDLSSHISDPTCSQSPGLHQSVEVVLNSYEGRTSIDKSQFGDSLRSQCINLSSGMANTNLKVPTGSPFLDISAEIHAYVGLDCSGASKNVFHFPRGLFQGYLTNALVLDDLGSSGDVEYTKIFLKSEFNFNRPTLIYNSFVGSINNQIIISPQSKNFGGSTSGTCSAANLPSGLIMDSSTCVISGSLSTALTQTNYPVILTTVDGLSVTANVSITVHSTLTNPGNTTPGNTTTNTVALNYLSSPQSLTVGTFTTITPTINNGNTAGLNIFSCTTNPLLPNGLQINGNTCVISGTPLTAQSATNYTVTVTNDHGLSGTGTVSITVIPIVPALSYASASGTVNTALTINPTNLNNNGAAISSCTSSDLPAGLSVNSFCVISGTPTTAGSASYPITVRNSAGSTNAAITITIAAIAPTLSYSGAGGTSGQVNSAMSISPTGLTTGGSAISNCTASLPTGLKIAPTTCVIFGTPTTSQTATNHTVTITNAHGLSNSGIVSITVGPQTPLVPTYLSLVNPLSSPGINKTPTIRVDGVLSGDTVKLFLNSTCSTYPEIGSAVSQGTSVNVKVNVPLSVSAYTIYAKSSNSSGVSPCSSVYLPYNVVNCPAGFIPVPHDTQVGTNYDFCVMKYEAKNNGNGGAVSQSNNPPYTSLAFSQAKTKCTDLNLSGEARYDLISNQEWMTIARNAEAVDQNWTSGSSGYGQMARGWSANTLNGDLWTNTSAAPSTSNCAYNSGADTCGYGGNILYRRTLNLSNNEVIWDFSGNVWEWVDWSIDPGLQLGPKTCPSTDTEFFYVQHLSCFQNGDILAEEIFPAFINVGSTEGVGRFYGGTGGAALRSGHWASGSWSGAYTLHLADNGDTMATYNFRGFRCVYRP